MWLTDVSSVCWGPIQSRPKLMFTVLSAFVMTMTNYIYQCVDTEGSWCNEYIYSQHKILSDWCFISLPWGCRPSLKAADELIEYISSIRGFQVVDFFPQSCSCFTPSLDVGPIMASNTRFQWRNSPHFMTPGSKQRKCLDFVCLSV